jgi:replicative DNA helicase
MTLPLASPAAGPAGHLPPQALELERSVLGAALLERAGLHLMLSILPSEEVFYADAHRFLYRAIRDLAHEGRAVDMLTVAQALRGAGVLDRVGGPAYVAGLTLRVNSSAHLETHCRILQEQHARRVIIEAGTVMQRHGYDEGRDPLELLADAQTQLSRLHHGLETRGAVSAAALLPGVLDGIRHAVGRHGLTGIPTGLRELNEATGGWQPTDLIVIGARPGMGKTAALLHHARTAALTEGIPTGIFSLEMPAQQLVARLLAAEVEGYSNADLRRGKLAGGLEEVEHIARQAHRLAKADNLFLDDTPALTLHQLSAKAARLVAEHGVRLLLVDYLQLMSGSAKSRGGNREQEISEISRGLKALAKQLHVPIIALSQLSRSVEQRGGEKRPQLSDLRESGAIEQDADVILFLWRGEYYHIEEYADGTRTQDTILYDIAKQRNGSLGELIFHCQISRGLFADLHPEGPASAGERLVLVEGENGMRRPLPARAEVTRVEDVPF